MQQPDTVDVVVGQNLRILRTGRTFSQTDLGDACHDKISAQQISKYELGENSVNASRLVEFARVLGCNLLDFFRGVKANGKD